MGPDPVLAMVFLMAVEEWASPQPSPNIWENTEVFGEGAAMEGSGDDNYW